jgi:hypothetical protein
MKLFSSDFAKFVEKLQKNCPRRKYFTDGTGIFYGY